MANEGEARFLPLSFYDGKCEIHVGEIRIHSSLDYKGFQSILSEKIGISPNQMSIYFVDNNNNPKLMHKRRILITGKSSFNLILQGKDCTVLAVLKRSRKHNRRQSSKLSNVPKPSYYENNNLAHNFYTLVWPVLPYYDQIAAQEYVNYNNRYRNLYNYYPATEEAYGRCNYRHCEECMNARSQGIAVQFHLCVNDAVTTLFRSPAGPIARPSVKFL